MLFRSYFMTTLGFKGPNFHSFVPELVEAMKGAYPELLEKQSFIEKEIRAEEERFFQTLDRGKKIFDAELEAMKKENRKIFSGEVAFLLYDSNGYPIDLTCVAARKLGIDVDLKRYEELMERQRSQSRGAETAAHPALEAVYSELGKDSKLTNTIFEGYESLEGRGKILALIQGGKKVETGSFDGSTIDVVLDQIGRAHV